MFCYQINLSLIKGIKHLQAYSPELNYTRYSSQNSCHSLIIGIKLYP